MKTEKNGLTYWLFAYPFGLCLGVSLYLLEIVGIVTVIGRENISCWPGNLIVVANHKSLLEPIILLGLFTRQFIWRSKCAPYNLAEEKNYGNWLFYLLRSRLILISRGNKYSEAKGLARAKSILESGGVLLLFPEGGRTSSRLDDEAPFLKNKAGHKIRRFKPGLAWLAVETSALVLPIWVSGTDRVLPNGAEVSHFNFPRFWRKVTIAIGQPLKFQGKNLDGITNVVESAVLNLAD